MKTSSPQFELMVTFMEQYGVILRTTLKKAARLHKSANAGGNDNGDPAMFTKLTNLEKRVLKIRGVQAAIGLAVEEAGLPQVNNTHLNSVEHIDSTPQLHQYIEVPVVPASPPPTRAISPPPHTFVEEEVQTSQHLHQPEQSASGQSPPESSSATTPHLSYVELHVEASDTNIAEANDNLWHDIDKEILATVPLNSAAEAIIEVDGYIKED
ncbi:unnamed protein product [Arctia plantaginis]|uniref:Uncharacterized protein n=1 Tax=Arctia plantaginis TaxID=874455 RepID=A0A8S0ZX11_ARCPL|nr:unnamed protein product [Arctia plantaginis]